MGCKVRIITEDLRYWTDGLELMCKEYGLLSKRNFLFEYWYHGQESFTST